MLATDPLSLLFLGCALVSGLFLVVSVALGAGHGHVGHLGHAGHLGHIGGHTGHIGHIGDAGHVAHVGSASASAPTHAAPSTAHARSAAPATPTAPSESLWSVAQSALLGSLNLNGALIFLLVFGVVGYLLHAGQATALVVVLGVPALVGALAAIGVNAALTRIFITTQAGELSSDSSRLEGHLASVSIAIRADGLGEVVYSGEAGARHSIGARSSDGSPVAVGTEVVIVEAHQGVATVQPWESFLGETRQRLSADPSAPRLTPAAPPGAQPQRGEPPDA